MRARICQSAYPMSEEPHTKGIMSAARPLVTVASDAKEQITMPAVLLAPIRPDIVHFVHTNMRKNRRQPYAVNLGAGMQHSAESWGTGRAVSRIPRVSGGGTHRAGQGAFGNMCRKGRMFAPTKIWRKWHRKINVNQKRYAVTSALAATAVPALVMARGHRVEGCGEIPVVVGSEVESISKTKEAVEVLKRIGCYEDVEKARDSKAIRSGKGKMRNRRHVMRRGPLIVFNGDEGITRAFRNLPGVELCHVERLNLLQLAPGSHLGRLVIWTAPAFSRLDEIYGTSTKFSKAKTGYKLPKSIVTNSDLARVINSDEIQSVLRPTMSSKRDYVRSRNPLKNKALMAELNPYVEVIRQKEAAHAEECANNRKTVLQQKRKAQHAKKTANRASKAAFYSKYLSTDQ